MDERPSNWEISEEIDSAQTALNRRFRGPRPTGLCFRCQSGFITRRQRDQDFRVYCQQIGQDMPPDIAECSKFSQEGTLHPLELARLAKFIDTDDKKNGHYF